MFNKNILVLDIEATGLDFYKNEIIQIAAILLDKKTLKEKKSFESFIKPTNWKSRDPEAMEVNNISWDMLKKAPSLKTVLKNFEKTFGTNVIVAPYGTILDTAMLRIAYKKCALTYKFDYHVFDIWPLVYIYMAKKRKLTNKKRFSGFSLEDAANHLGIKIEAGRHTALIDCRLEAEVLRKIVKKVKV